VTAAALEPFRAFLASGAGKVKQGKAVKTPLKDATNNAFHVYGRDDLDLVDVPEPAALIAAATPGAPPSPPSPSAPHTFPAEHRFLRQLSGVVQRF